MLSREDRVKIWNALHGLNLVPISQTRHRIAGCLRDAREIGLITPEEQQALLDADMKWRQEEMARREAE